MRLLNTENYEFEEFYDLPPGPYAVLSHRWQTGEVSYQDVLTGVHKSRQGWAKIQGFCEKALSQNIKWAWVDTCCIDSNSSAELIESINSMYQWYKSSRECYVYLGDVNVPDLESDDHRSRFAESAWFTRGWTLQELIAPPQVLFFNHQWLSLGSKRMLQNVLEKITRISTGVLCGNTQLSECSIPQRMSWAAGRQTAKQEDQAYSLLGIFDVNMPMLYGERKKSFQRLQKEIIAQLDDHSIFAWRDKNHVKGFLAPSPDCFVGLHHITRIYPANDATYGFSLLNAGLSIQLRLIPWTMNTYLAPLRCGSPKRPSAQSGKPSFQEYNRVCIFLRQTEHDNQFVRVSIDQQDLIEIDGDKLAELQDQFDIKHRHIIIQHMDPFHLVNYSDPFFYGYEFQFEHSKVFGTSISPSVQDIICFNDLSDAKTPRLEIEIGTQTAAGVLHLRGFPGFLLMYLGFDMDFAPLCLITNRTPPATKLESLPASLSLLSRTEKVQMLDINWLIDQIAHPVHSSETFLAFKGHRHEAKYVECKVLDLRLTFETRFSPVIGKQAWTVHFQHLPTSLPFHLCFPSPKPQSTQRPMQLSHSTERNPQQRQRSRSRSRSPLRQDMSSGSARKTLREEYVERRKRGGNYRMVRA